MSSLSPWIADCLVIFINAGLWLVVNRFMCWHSSPSQYFLLKVKHLNKKIFFLCMFPFSHSNVEEWVSGPDLCRWVGEKHLRQTGWYSREMGLVAFPDCKDVHYSEWKDYLLMGNIPLNFWFSSITQLLQLCLLHIRDGNHLFHHILNVSP